MFIEDRSLQLVLVKPSDLVINEPIQTKESDSLLVELEGFQPIEFELVCKNLTPNNIKRTYVLVHHYHNVFVQDNDVIVSNDQNEMFRKALIDAYLLGVSNPKGYLHSQPHRHFYLN
jgi:hypothetical protein